MSETAYAAYLRLREDWHALVSDRDQPMRSEWKDGLYAQLTRAWNRLAANEKHCAGMHCRAVYAR